MGKKLERIFWNGKEWIAENDGRKIIPNSIHLPISIIPNKEGTVTKKEVSDFLNSYIEEYPALGFSKVNAYSVGLLENNDRGRPVQLYKI